MRWLNSFVILLFCTATFILLAPVADAPSNSDETGGILWRTLRPLWWVSVILALAGFAIPILMWLTSGQNRK